jgi:uncharacterized membrane protein (UPF0127 family)
MRHGTLLGKDGSRRRVQIPQTRNERRRGLLGRDSIDPDAAMLFERCRSVHTFGMAFPISVVLLDRDLRVVAVRCLAPGRVLLPRRGVSHVLECAEGSRFEPGERLLLREERPRELAGEPHGEETDGRSPDHDERDHPADRAG